MQQPPVISTVESHPNPSATHTRESSVSFNLNYLTSPNGILKLLEIVFGLICWALIASKYSNRIPEHEFALAITIIIWLVTIFTFIIFLCGCHANMCSGMPCLIIEFVFNILWAIFYLAAASSISAKAFNVSELVAGAVFAFFVTAFYGIHVFVSFKEWRGGYPWN